MGRFALSTRRMRLVALSVAVMCALALLPAAGAVAAPATPECATAMPIAELQALLDAEGTDPDTGEQNPVAADGLTVVRGTKPQVFNAGILAIDYGGAGIDHDLILAELSGLGIDGERGVWAGMSGSPVYIGDQLVGAVSYGFSWGPNNLAGITPAAEMFELTQNGVTQAQAPAAMSLSDSQRRTVAAQTGTSASSVPSSVPRLAVPLAMNVGARRLAWLQDQAAADGSPIMPVAGRGVSVQAVGDADISAGSNFAASVSYGDITSAGTGTTTWTCMGEALAFGHPFFWGGKTELGLHPAYSVDIIDDATLGSYKLATLGDPLGLVDQDRYTGIRGEVTGMAPAATEVTSYVVAEDAEGNLHTDEGTTSVVLQDAAPFITFIHGFSNMDFALDRYYSDGSSELTWTVDMTVDGQSYRLQRTNQFTSPFDISIDSMFEPWMQLEQLLAGANTPVRFDDISLQADVVDTQRYHRLRRIEVRKDGEWVTSGRVVRVDPGDTLRVRAVLERYNGAELVSVSKPSFWYSIPNKAAGAFGELFVGQSGGHGGGEFCFMYGECGSSASGADTFQDLIDRLENAPRNDEVRSRLRLFGENGRWSYRRTMLMPKAVVGARGVSVRVRGGR